MPDGITAGGERHTADYYICALPFERLPALGLPAPAFEHSPITGIHLWFDRPVTDLPHATLLDRTMQWMFNKSEGRYLQLVVSASRELAAASRADIIALAVRELGEFFPRAREARLEKAHVIKELRATFSAAPGTEALRPPAEDQPSGSVSGRRLDALRLARHHGGRRAQRISGCRGRGARERPAGAIPAAGYRVKRQSQPCHNRGMRSRFALLTPLSALRVSRPAPNRPRRGSMCWSLMQGAPIEHAEVAVKLVKGEKPRT